MSNFKVGDNVLVVKTDYPKIIPIGSKAVVFSFYLGYPRIKIGDEKREWVMRESELELISTPTKSKEDTNKSQNKQILLYLQSGATINPISALELFGSFRLSARINDLRNDGHNIKTTMVYNGKKRWANYSLVTK